MKISRRQLSRLICEALINEDVDIDTDSDTDTDNSSGADTDTDADNSPKSVAENVERFLKRKGYKFTIGDIDEAGALFRLYFRDYRDRSDDDDLHNNAINELKKAGFDYDYIIETSDFVRYIPGVGPFLPNTKIISVFPKGKGKK